MLRLSWLVLFILVANTTLSAAMAAGDPASGQQAWTQLHESKAGEKPRSCATCHGTDLTQTGKHVRTGKRIEPMAVSVNPERLTDSKKVAKWFKRNCKWTWGRECTSTEKDHFIAYLKQQ